MALVKLGGGITAMSGSIAGNTFARNRFGNYVRSRTKPVNPRSTGQVLIRSILSQLAENWKDVLTDPYRLAWAAYAASINMKNRLGEVMNATGFNHYIRSNSPRMQYGFAAINTAPTVLSLPEKDPLFAVAAAQGTGLTTITFDDTLAWCDLADAAMIIYNGIPQNATRNFFNGPWKLAGGILGDVGSPPTSPRTLTGSNTLVTGQKIWYYGRISLPDGRLSEPFRADCIVS
jgi:hypothetical protein